MWKETSGEYVTEDGKLIIDPRGNITTKIETKFKYWAMEQYGMTSEEYRGYTFKGTGKTLLEAWEAKDKMMFILGLPNLVKNAAKEVKDVAKNGVHFDTSIGFAAGRDAAEESAKDVTKNEIDKKIENISKEIVKEKKKDDIYIPLDVNGNPIPLKKQKVNGQDIPLPDPEAIGAHTVIGSKRSTKTGEIYRQSATFPEGTWPLANGQNVPWSEVHWTNHGRGDHTNPHQHIFEYNPDKGGWIRGGPTDFKK